MLDKNKEELSFLEDGDIITIDGEEDKFTYYKKEKCLKRDINSMFVIRIEDLKIDWIIKVERLVNIYNKGSK